MLARYAPVTRPGTYKNPFVYRLRRSETVDDYGVRLTTNMWRILLAGLYLEYGEYITRNAKDNGVSFGFCNRAGHLKPMNSPEATHFGWSEE